MAKVTLRKDGRWTVARRRQGKQIFGYGNTPEEAEDNLEAKIERLIRLTPNAGELLHDFAKRAWYPSIEHLAPLSKKKYEGIYKNHIGRSLGSYPLQDVDFAVVQVWVNDLTRAGVGSTTVRYAKDLLGQILNLAVDMGSVDRNPSRRVKVPRGARKRERALAPEKAQEVLDAVDGTDLHAPIFLAVVFGLRRGEIAGLKWEDLDRQRGELKIQRQRQAIRPLGVVERDLKSDGSRRTLRLPPRFIEDIDRIGNLDSLYVCTKGDQPWVPDTITEHWGKIRDGLGLAEWTFHDLRHGAAGLLHAAGCDLVQIASILGHTNPDMSWLYTTASEKSQRDGIQLLADLFERTNKN